MLDLARSIRTFEFAVIKHAKDTKFPGSIHPCIGQELPMCEVMGWLRPGDWVVGNHRSHGHYLAYRVLVHGDTFEESVTDLWNEIFNLPSGCSSGVGGSQHLKDSRGFVTTGIQGGLTAFGVGLAYSMKLKCKDSVVFVFVGDGTLGQGVFWEAVELAVMLRAPVIFVVEDNQYAMSTHKPQHRDTISMLQSHGLKRISFEEDFRRAVYQPGFVYISTYRHCGHSISDNRNYRRKSEETYYRNIDPLNGYLLDELPERRN